MKTPIRIIAAVIVLCMALISVSCSSDGTSTVYVGVGYGGYGGYGPGWGGGWGGYGGGYYPPPVVVGPIGPPPPVAMPF
jgi:hypothetical protein